VGRVPGCGPILTRLVGLELVRVSIPLRKSWVSDAGTFSRRDSLLVRAVLEAGGPGGTDQEIEGWGECGAFPDPTYTSEYTAAAVEVSLQYLVPALFRAGATRAVDVRPALAAIRGHKMAKTAFEAALLDAELRVTGRSMANFFSEFSEGAQPHRATVTAGVAVGIASSTAELVDDVERCVGEGYRRVKLKIGPGHDLQPVSAVRERWPGLALFADANGSYQDLPLSETAELLSMLEPFDLACIEQPLGDEDLAGHAELARRIRPPICLDESLTSRSAVAVALDMGACSVVSIKAGRLGGYLEAVRVHDLCAQRKVPTWYGGMVETGIARAANVALAALPNFSLPGDLSATGRFFETDLTSPLSLLAGGTIVVPDGPGSGVTVHGDVVSSFSTWRRWCPVGG
jgi:o-succinylbenzoate synthase